MGGLFVMLTAIRNKFNDWDKVIQDKIKKYSYYTVIYVHSAKNLKLYKHDNQIFVQSNLTLGMYNKLRCLVIRALLYIPIKNEIIL